ncbi:MAG: hypothetical protein NC222_06745 [Staphylococcus sp.]|nr:hypothetical protein [Staphylococcus sp.]
MKLFNKIKGKFEVWFFKRFNFFFYGFSAFILESFNKRLNYLENKLGVYDEVNKTFESKYYFLSYSVVFVYPISHNEKTIEEKIKNLFPNSVNIDASIYEVPSEFGYVIEVRKDFNNLRSTSIELIGGYRIHDKERILRLLPYLRKENKIK